VKKPLTFDDVRRLAEALEDVEIGTTYGTPALKVRGKVFACIATNRSAEPGTLVVVVGFEERDRLLEADPATYYLKDHYRSSPSILVRLARVHRDALRDLLRMAWTFVARTARRRRTGRGPSNQTLARTAGPKPVR